MKYTMSPKNGAPPKSRPGNGSSKFSPNSTKGVGFVKPAYGIASKATTLAMGAAGPKVTKNASAHLPEQMNSKPARATASAPAPSHPQSQNAFHALGAPKGGKY